MVWGVILFYKKSYDVAKSKQWYTSMSYFFFNVSTKNNVNNPIVGLPENPGDVYSSIPANKTSLDDLTTGLINSITSSTSEAVNSIIGLAKSMLGINPSRPPMDVSGLIESYGLLHKAMLMLSVGLIIAQVILIFSWLFYFYKDYLDLKMSKYSWWSNKGVVYILRVIEVRNKFMVFFWPLLSLFALSIIVKALVFLINHPLI